jgi:3-phosphoshikimate 1-carboxyvinyltransferase
MNLKVNPASRLEGTIVPPASKSYSIRAFIIASLGGKSKIINPSNSIDCKVAIDNCRRLGAKIKRVDSNVYLVDGFDKNRKSQKILDVKESGTTLRFMISLASIFPGRTVIRGTGTLRSRPNRPLINALKYLGIKIRGTGPKATVPIVVSGGSLKGGKLEIDGTLSSQFISSILITAPNFSGNTRLRIIGDHVVSQPYIDMTLAVLKRSGVRIERINGRNYFIRGNQRFSGIKEFRVPPDYGLSGFFMAAASLVSSDLLINGLLSDNLVQADRKILHFLKQMGVKYKQVKAGMRIKGPFGLKGGTFILRDSPDLVPIMGILALFASGKTRLCGIRHVRIKESNRISHFRQELLKIRARVEEKEDELIIYPCFALKADAVLDPHNDHRLAMAFTILGLAHKGIMVKNIGCVAKSYPDFLNDLKKIGANFTII